MVHLNFSVNETKDIVCFFRTPSMLPVVVVKLTNRSILIHAHVKIGFERNDNARITLLDKLEGKEAKVVGRDNTKDGPDRVVDKVFIQTKYYSSGKGCIDACFDKETGQFRYITDDGPMLIEVPKDKYADAINAFRNKILEEKVPGVTNPDDASKYIKRGKLTYIQAKNYFEEVIRQRPMIAEPTPQDLVDFVERMAENASEEQGSTAT